MNLKPTEVLQALFALINSLLPLVTKAITADMADPDEAEELAAEALEVANEADPSPEDGIVPVVVNGIDIFDPVVEALLARALGRIAANANAAIQAGRYSGSRKLRASKWAARLLALTGKASS